MIVQILEGGTLMFLNKDPKTITEEGKYVIKDNSGRHYALMIKDGNRKEVTISEEDYYQFLFPNGV
jgi:hypothetical protein